LVFPGEEFDELRRIDVFADPLSVTYNTVAKSLPAIGRGDTASTYQLNDTGVVYTLTISHQFKTRNRVVARLQRTASSTDPLIPAQNILASATATVTLDFPTVGLTPVDAQSLGNALVGFLSSANLLKMANGET
jgi:hypothetical protein